VTGWFWPKPAPGLLNSREAAVDPKQPLKFSENPLIRLLLVTTAMLIVCACSSTVGVVKSDDYAIVSTVIEEGCDRPGVRLDNVTNTDSGETTPLESRYGPIELRSGHYAISVACQNPLDESGNACQFWGHPNEYPTYKMQLSAGVVYAFRCFVDGQELSYRISESTF